MRFFINTTNENKQKEFKRLFDQCGHEVFFTDKDIDEIVADPMTVIMHKAAMVGQQIFVEDTSLDIKGHDFGIAIKHKIHELDTVIGSVAVCNVYMAFCHESQIFIFKGTVNGMICPKRGESGFGFDPYFVPDGQTKTLAEEKLDDYNARALCVRAVINGEVFAVEPMSKNFQSYILQKK